MTTTPPDKGHPKGMSFTWPLLKRLSDAKERLIFSEINTSLENEGDLESPSLAVFVSPFAQLTLCNRVGTGANPLFSATFVYRAATRSEDQISCCDLTTASPGKYPPPPQQPPTPPVYLTLPTVCPHNPVITHVTILFA
ncbi:hypothetical protein J6590_023920 [Homalodisca vitripennis]|nr:hypothetical protein J6590_023920 [Homalodisca vitripennis]